MTVKLYISLLFCKCTCQARLKSVAKMSSGRQGANSKSWAPLPDHFINERLLKMFPLFDQAQLQLVDVMTCCDMSSTLGTFVINF